MVAVWKHNELKACLLYPNYDVHRIGPYATTQTISCTVSLVVSETSVDYYRSNYRNRKWTQPCADECVVYTRRSSFVLHCFDDDDDDDYSAKYIQCGRQRPMLYHANWLQSRHFPCLLLANTIKEIWGNEGPRKRSRTFPGFFFKFRYLCAIWIWNNSNIYK